jgi:DnaJ-domain-containing protein 1
MVKCPSCARVQSPRLLCPECGAPLAVQLDCFAALELPRKLAIDATSLERAYHDLGRRIHPDRHASGSAAMQDASLRATALLTRSYRTLRDPVSRGLYWLELDGQKLGDGNKQVPAELAEMVFEVQEQLAELRAAHAAGEAGAIRTEVVSRKRAELKLTMDQLQAELARNFARWDADDGGAHAHLTAELKSILSRIAYLRTLLRDVDRELESVKAEGRAETDLDVK